eukprot:673428-Prorocentrum_minimum.AAC.2
MSWDDLEQHKEAAMASIGDCGGGPLLPIGEDSQHSLQAEESAKSSALPPPLEELSRAQRQSLGQLLQSTMQGEMTREHFLEIVTRVAVHRCVLRVF